MSRPDNVQPPDLFEVINLADRLIKDVDDHVGVIHNNTHLPFFPLDPPQVSQ
jgi:hypothetical protein